MFPYILSRYSINDTTDHRLTNCSVNIPFKKIVIVRDNVSESDVFVMFDVPFKLTQQVDRLTEGRDECKMLPYEKALCI
jgi:hypothetical protein